MHQRNLGEELLIIFNKRGSIIVWLTSLHETLEWPEISLLLVRVS